MLTAVMLAFINHLLVSQTWAMARLQPFTGRTVRLRCLFFDVCARIDETGALRAVSDTAHESADVSLSLALEDLAASRQQSDQAERIDNALFTTVRIEGAADLAEVLAVILRNLRWDIEDDLSHCIGDIAARRLVQGSRAILSGTSQAAWNFSQNFAEYFSAEKSLVIHQTDIAAFARRVDALVVDTAWLEQRLAQLEAPIRQ